MNTIINTPEHLVSKVTHFQRFYGTQPENPDLIQIEDLRTEKTRGKCPVTMRFAFDFESKQDYLDWVKTWKATMNELVRRVRVCGAAFNAGRKRNGLPAEAQTQAEQKMIDAWKAYSDVQKPLQEAFKAKFGAAKPGTAYGVYFYDHPDTARILLSLRKAAKIDARRRYEAARVPVAA